MRWLLLVAPMAGAVIETTARVFLAVEAQKSSLSPDWTQPPDVPRESRAKVTGATPVRTAGMRQSEAAARWKCTHALVFKTDLHILLILHVALVCRRRVVVSAFLVLFRHVLFPAWVVAPSTGTGHRVYIRKVSERSVGLPVRTRACLSAYVPPCVCVCVYSTKLIPQTRAVRACKHTRPCVANVVSLVTITGTPHLE